jgi:hypothetical protein
MKKKWAKNEGGFRGVRARKSVAAHSLALPACTAHVYRPYRPCILPAGGIISSVHFLSRWHSTSSIAPCPFSAGATIRPFSRQGPQYRPRDFSAQLQYCLYDSPTGTTVPPVHLLSRSPATACPIPRPGAKHHPCTFSPRGHKSACPISQPGATIAPVHFLNQGPQ